MPILSPLTPLRPLTRIAAWVVLATLPAACTSLLSPPAASAEDAAALSQRGDHAGAARIWEELAAHGAGAERTGFLLQAAGAWLHAGTPDYAARALAAIDTPLSPAEAQERSLLQIELALDRGQGSEAWASLAALPAPATAPQAPRYLELRERAAFASGRPLEGIRAELDRERWLTSPGARVDSRSALLRELREAVERGIKLEPQDTRDPLVRGWLELAPVAAAMARNPVTAMPQLDAWRARYPTHPAGEVARIALLSRSGGAQPEAVAHVALLLPVSGPLAGAASSVREGFLAAANRAPEAGRPLIRVYDTASMSVSDAIANATAEGAEFIAGPLTRDELLAASDYASRRPPLLALNFLPPERPAPANFYQFALSPEDEARAVARRLIALGERRGIVFAPSGEWGDRVLAAFTEELLAGGGQVIARAALESGRADFSAAITEALRLTDSRARARRLEGLLGTTLAFEPRRRADAEFIFAATQPAMARLLRPQLKFHYAGDIPTYATSDAYDPSPTANEDLDGLLFPEMPWMLGTGALAAEVRDSIRDPAQIAGARRGRLFAFGFDAYGLVAALRSGAPLHLEGLTGVLTLGADRRIKRELTWAHIRNGQAEMLADSASN